MVDHPKYKTDYRYSPVLPLEIIKDRAKILRWAFEYSDGDSSLIEDHQFNHMAEQSILANPSMMVASPDFPVPLKWEFAAFGDLVKDDGEIYEHMQMTGWSRREEAESLIEYHTENNERYQNIKLFCRLTTDEVEVIE